MLRFLGARIGNAQLHGEHRRRARTLVGERQGNRDYLEIRVLVWRRVLDDRRNENAQSAFFKEVSQRL